ncbi:pentapeptide repeat-containing protein [bacterium]|nr:pentapeptide repeat-containing protein [candidate division CSSED10-310 bacterium]
MMRGTDRSGSHDTDVKNGSANTMSAGDLVRGRKVSGADLRGIDATGLKMRATEFENVDLREARFAGADLRRCRFTDCRLDGVDVSRCRLCGAQFIRCGMKGAVMTSADADDTRLRDCDLTGADLRHASLRNSQLWNCDLRGSHFDGAVLHGMSAHGCTFDPHLRDTGHLGGAQFKGTGMTAASYARLGLLILVMLSVVSIGMSIHSIRTNPDNWDFSSFVLHLDQLLGQNQHAKVLELAKRGSVQFSKDLRKRARMFLYMGNALKGLKRTDEALDYCRKALEDADGEFTVILPAHYCIFDLLFNRRQFEKLLGIMAGFETDPANIEHRFWLMRSTATVYEAMENWQAAQDVLEQMLEVFRESPERVMETRKLLAKVQLKTSDSRNAVEIFENLLRDAATQPDRLRTFVDLIRAQFEVGEKQQARQRFLENEDTILVTVDQETDSLLMQLAEMYRNESQFDIAERIFNSLITNGSSELTRAVATRGKGQSLQQRGRLNEAVGLYQEALVRFATLEKEPEEIKTLLAPLMRTNGRREDAMALYQEIERSTDDPVRANWARDNLAHMHIESGDLSRAEEMFRINHRKALARNDYWNANNALVSIANLLLRKGSRAEAIEILTTIADDSHSGNQGSFALRRLAEIQSEAGDTEAAMRIYDRIQKQYAGDTELVMDALFGKTELLRRLGKSQEAMDLYNEIAGMAERAEQRARALEGQAHIMQEQGRREEAEAIFRNIIDTYATQPMVAFKGHSGLYNLLKSTEQQEAAENELNQMLAHVTDRGLRRWLLFELVETRVRRGNLPGARETLAQIREEFAGTQHETEADRRLRELFPEERRDL